MKKASSWLWGGVLIVLGVILGLNALGLARISIFFPGWWTLFIIVPCLINLLTGEHKGSAAFGLLLGVCLLLGCWGYLSFSVMWKLILPVLLVFIGFGVIAHGMSNGDVNEKIREIRKERRAERRAAHHKYQNTTIRATVTETDADGHQTKRTYSNRPKDGEEDINEILDAEIVDDDDDEDDENEYVGKEFWSTFSDQEINYKGKDFDGCRIDAVFGGADLDLRGAKIKNNSIIKTSSVFGGIIIYVPEDVKIEMTSTAIFGGITDKRMKSEKTEKTKKTEKTIYLDATCVFGGVEIR